MCATRLHNYCINEGPDNHAATSSDDDDEVDVFIPSSYDTAPVPGTSVMREILMEEIQRMGLSRPKYNIESNKQTS